MATPTNSKPLRAWVYSRVSSDEQEKGTSLAYQPDECRRFAEREGLIVVGESQDVMSGLQVNRPGYRQMLDSAKAREFDRVLVWRYDRLGRRESEWHRCLEELEGWGIEVWSATEPCDSLYKSIAAGLAADEVRKLSKRVLQGKQARFREGYWHGTVPFGYTGTESNRQGSILIPDALDENGEAIEGSPAWLTQQLYLKYAAGESIRALRGFLAYHGVEKSTYGVRYILQSSVYIGKVRCGTYSKPKVSRAKTEQAEVDGQHMPLVGKELFGQVQARLESRSHLKHRGPEGTYLFRGLIYCASCGKRYVGKRSRPSKGGTYYVCNRKLNLNACQSHTVGSAKLEKAVVEPLTALLGQLSSADFQEHVKAMLAQRAAEQSEGADTALSALTGLKESLEAELEKLTDRFMADLIPQDYYLKNRKRVEGELESVNEKLANLPKPAPAPDLGQLFALADSLQGEPLDDQELREVVESTLSKITIVDGQICVEWKPFIADLVKTVAGA